LLVLALVGALLWRKFPWLGGSADPSAVAKIKVAIRSQPAGAKITVDGAPCGEPDCNMALAAGTHQAQAELPGYEPAVSSFILREGVAAPDVTLSLSPAPIAFTARVDREAAIVLDDGAPIKTQPGLDGMAKLSPGKHEVQVESGSIRLRFGTDITPGTLPAVTELILSGDVRAFVLTRFGAQAHLYGTVAGVVVSIDGRSAGLLDGGSGIGFSGLAPGSHDLVLDGPRPGQHTKLTFEIGPTGGILASIGR
jgi:hypothetical protein